MIVETIPIPRHRARAADDFQVRVSDLHAWPGHELLVEFEYNEYRDRYVWSLRDTQYGKFFAKDTATLGYDYDAGPYFRCRFIDETGSAEAVTPQNLGRNVVLSIVPKALGGQFHPDAEISEAEAYRVTNRRAWEPVR